MAGSLASRHYRRLVAASGEDNIQGGNARWDVPDRNQEKDFLFARLPAESLRGDLRSRRLPEARSGSERADQQRPRDVGQRYRTSVSVCRGGSVSHTCGEEKKKSPKRREQLVGRQQSKQFLSGPGVERNIGEDEKELARRGYFKRKQRQKAKPELRQEAQVEASSSPEVTVQRRHQEER